MAITTVALIGLAGPVAATAGASNRTSPYAPGTMFVADQSCSCVWEIPPGGSPQVFEGVSESDQDVATDAAGDVFWTQADNGAVEDLTTGGLLETVASGFSSPWGIGVDQSGDVYVGAFGGPGGGPAGLYEIPSGGSPSLVTSQFGVWTSVAVDGNGDVWGAGSNAGLVMVPAGSTSGVSLTVPGYGYINGVRLDAANDLYASTGNNVAIELPAGSASPTSFGSGLGYTEGVAVDGSGDVFVGVPSGVPGYGKVYEISGGTQSLYASGSLAYTGGLALWPPLAPTARTASSTTLSSGSPSTVTTQTPVTLTATVSGSNAGGYVQFEDNNAALGGLVALSGGQAQTTVTLPKGANQISATYLGDGSNAPSVSNPLAFTATPIATTTVITAPDGTTVPGDGDATVDATVTGQGGTPTGDVDFYVNGAYQTSQSLTGGEASASFPLPPGKSNVYAVYDGDSTFDTSTSNTIPFKTVPPYNPTMSGSVRYGPPNAQNAVKATITVTVTGVTGNGAPTGAVKAGDSFTCGALRRVAGTLKSKATCTRVIPYGTYQDVTIKYKGSKTYTAASTSVFINNGGG